MDKVTVNLYIMLLYTLSVFLSVYELKELYTSIGIQAEGRKDEIRGDAQR